MIADEVGGRFIPGEGLGNLRGQPPGRGIAGHAGPNQHATRQMNDDQATKPPEANSWHYDQVDGCNAIGAIAQKNLPALRWVIVRAINVGFISQNLTDRMHCATRCVDDLVGLGARQAERRCEAQDVALRHGTGDHATFQQRRRDPRADF